MRKDPTIVARVHLKSINVIENETENRKLISYAIWNEYFEHAPYRQLGFFILKQKPQIIKTNTIDSELPRVRPENSETLSSATWCIVCCVLRIVDLPEPTHFVQDQNMLAEERKKAMRTNGTINGIEIGCGRMSTHRTFATVLRSSKRRSRSHYSTTITIILGFGFIS